MNTLKTILLSAGLTVALQISGALAQVASPVAPAFEGPATTVEFTAPGDVAGVVFSLSPKNGRINGKPVGLTVISITEKGDEPCAIRAIYTELADGDVFSGLSWVSPNSGCSVEDTSGRIVLHSNTAPNRNFDSDYFISSVGTCTNGKSNERGLLVKGLAGNAAEIDAEGKVLVSNAPLRMETQPNCKADEFTFSACPPGQIAMGLNVRALPIGGKESITGLQLKCKAVTGRIAARDGFKGGSKGN